MGYKTNRNPHGMRAAGPSQEGSQIPILSRPKKQLEPPGCQIGSHLRVTVAHPVGVTYPELRQRVQCVCSFGLAKVLADETIQLYSSIAIKERVVSPISSVNMSSQPRQNRKRKRSASSGSEEDDDDATESVLNSNCSHCGESCQVAHHGGT